MDERAVQAAMERSTPMQRIVALEAAFSAVMEALEQKHPGLGKEALALMEQAFATSPPPRATQEGVRADINLLAVALLDGITKPPGGMN